MSQMESIGKRIQKLLELRNMTQRELAKKIGITEVSIGRYIKDTREPKATVLADIALALDSTTDYLTGISDNPENEDNNEYEIQTIAAHHEGEEWTEEELEELEMFKELVRQRRKKRNK